MVDWLIRAASQARWPLWSGHLVKAGEGGAECPDDSTGMDDLMWWASGGRSVERERVYIGRSISRLSGMP